MSNQEKYLKKIVEFCLLNLYLSLFYAEDLLNNLQKIFGPILAKTFTLEKCIKIFNICQKYLINIVTECLVELRKVGGKLKQGF